MRIFADAVVVAMLCVATLSPGRAHAQGRNLDIERFRPTPDRYGFLGIPGTRTPGPWAWDVSMWFNYASEPLTLRRIGTGDLVPIVSHRVTADVVSQLGVLDRLAVVVAVPVIVFQDTDNEPLDSGPAIAALAFRDPYVAVRARLLGEGSTPDHEAIEGEGLAVQLGMTLPVGLEQSFAGEGSPQLDARVVADFRFFDFAIGGELGYRHRFAEPRLLGVSFRNEVFFGAAVQTPTFVVPNLSALVEIRVTTAVDAEVFRDASTAVEGDLGARWSEGDVSLTWAVGMGFSGGVGTPGFRGMFGVEFSPRTHDIDGDGLEDGADQCERLPEDIDEFEDEDGCPDLDNDGDLVPDDDDRCPDEAADFDRDEDEDGCTDPVSDRDQDGVEDADDACPDRPEDADGFEDEDGCPDLDDDHDRVLDVDDRCPSVPEDADGFEDADGCPDLDDDADGVPDVSDACPRVAEDRDGFEDEDGCPDPDNDRDGVLDGDDTCPERAESINGVDDTDGCPDRGGRVLWVPDGDGEPPPLRGRIRFAADGTIRSISSASLDQLALHLIARWGSRWVLSVPAAEAPRQAALSAALVERGVPEGTFEVVADATLSGWSVTLASAPPSP